MGHKADLSEVIDFSDEFKSKSEEMKVSLSKVEQNIQEICNMSSFSGKTADQAKLYFSDLHLTVLTTFSGVLTDLYHHLNKHIEDFQAKVDESNNTVIKSDYVRDAIEDVHEGYERLQTQHDAVSNTLRNVSDISSAVTPSFSSINNDNDSSIRVAENLLDDLNSFTSTGRSDASQIESLLQEIKTTLNHAGAVSGSARFTDYRGSSTAIALTNLKEYNQANQQVRQEQIDNLDEESRAIYEKAKKDYENGEIDKSVFDSIVSGIIHSGAAFIKNAATSKVTNEVSERIAGSIVSWAQRNTFHFVDPALAVQTVGGGVVTQAAPPSALTSAIRTGARYAPPVVGSAIDFGIQVYKGEDVTDAVIKTGGHLGAGMAGAAIGSAVPFIGTAGGFAIGVIGSMVFDWAYDANKDKIKQGLSNFAEGTVDTIGNIGDSVKGFFGGLGSVFN